jgi:hypothetical protein
MVDSLILGGERIVRRERGVNHGLAIPGCPDTRRRGERGIGRPWIRPARRGRTEQHRENREDAA